MAAAALVHVGLGHNKRSASEKVALPSVGVVSSLFSSWPIAVRM